MLHERSSASLYAKSVFFEAENDIDIYVEDTAQGYEKLYGLLLSRLLNEKYRVERVYPIGNRKQVIDKYEADKENLRRASLFIIDGDLLILRDDDIANKEGLYKLPCYCVENLLIDKNSLINLLDEEETERNLEIIEREFDFDGWKSRNVELLNDLFIEYAILFKVDPTNETVGYKVTNLVSNGIGELDATKVQKRILEVRNKSLQSISIEEYELIKHTYSRKYNAIKKCEFQIVSGKDYVMPLMMARIRSMVNTKCSNISIKQRFARTCSLTMIEDAINHIKTA